VNLPAVEEGERDSELTTTNLHRNFESPMRA
jgi:hypothetical protein